MEMIRVVGVCVFFAVSVSKSICFSVTSIPVLGKPRKDVGKRWTSCHDAPNFPSGRPTGRRDVGAGDNCRSACAGINR